MMQSAAEIAASAQCRDKPQLARRGEEPAESLRRGAQRGKAIDKRHAYSSFARPTIAYHCAESKSFPRREKSQPTRSRGLD